MNFNKYVKGAGFYILLFMLIMAIAAGLTFSNKGEKKAYSDFVILVKEHQIKEIKVITSKNKLSALTLEDKRVETEIPSVEILYQDIGNELSDQRDDGTMRFSVESPKESPWWLATLPQLFALVLGVMLFISFMHQVQGGKTGSLSFGKSRARLNDSQKNKVNFNDVAGADEEKEELEEIVDFLKNPKKFRDLGARIPKGILMIGPPGTGKTLLAKAIAGEAGVPFFTISGSDFVEMFVGVGASRVRDLFEQAKKQTPCIIFIDEIDAVGRHRGAGLGGGHDEREQTLNQLLVEMDGFGVNEGVIVIAATNRPDILDPALLRPGRFDRQVTVSYPDVKGRQEILQVHAKNKPLGEDVNLATIAKTTAGFTGADLENLMNESALLAAKKNQTQIVMKNIEDSILKVIMGPEKRSKKVIEKERKITAYHEAGHAVVSKFLPTQDPVHQVSILSRGNAGGYTLHLPKEDKHYSSKTEMVEKIIVLLGGRVAEKLALDDIGTGASNDIERSTKIAQHMVIKYGMSDRLGPLTFGQANEEIFLGKEYGHTKDYSECTAAQIDEEIKAIIDQCYKKCEEILSKNMNKLHKIADELLQKEKIDADEFEALFEGA